MTLTAVASGQLIAEFGGTVFVAMRHATADIDHQCVAAADRVDMLDRTVTLACECGASAEWSQPLAPAKPFFYTYAHRYPGDPDFRLAIIRTRLTAPICEHWQETPLSL